MGKNRLFFPQEALDRWLVKRVADLSGDQLWLREEGRRRCGVPEGGRCEVPDEGRDPGQRFRLVEGVRVLSEVSGAEDALDLCGSVKTLRFLLELGAELLGDSMIVAENAYQIVPGWLATRVPGSAELRFPPQPAAEGEPDLDQQFSSFLARNA